MSDRYTIERDGVAYHVLDGERALATCASGTHEENRRDAEHIKSLLNDEAAGAPVLRPVTASSRFQVDLTSRGWRVVSPWIPTPEQAAEGDEYRLDVGGTFGHGEEGKARAEHVARELNAAMVPGWRPVTESEPGERRRVLVPRWDSLSTPPETVEAWRRVGRWHYRGPERSAKTWDWEPPAVYLPLPPLPSEGPEGELTEDVLAGWEHFLRVSGIHARAAAKASPAEPTDAEIRQAVIDAGLAPASAAWHRWADKVSAALNIEPPDGIAAEMEADDGE